MNSDTGLYKLSGVISVTEDWRTAVSVCIGSIYTGDMETSLQQLVLAEERHRSYKFEGKPQRWR